MPAKGLKPGNEAGLSARAKEEVEDLLADLQWQLRDAIEVSSRAWKKEAESLRKDSTAFGESLKRLETAATEKSSSKEDRQQDTSALRESLKRDWQQDSTAIRESLKRAESVANESHSSQVAKLSAQEARLDKLEERLQADISSRQALMGEIERSILADGSGTGPPTQVPEQERLRARVAELERSMARMRAEMDQRVVAVDASLKKSEGIMQQAASWGSRAEEIFQRHTDRWAPFDRRAVSQKAEQTSGTTANRAAPTSKQRSLDV